MIQDLIHDVRAVPAAFEWSRPSLPSESAVALQELQAGVPHELVEVWAKFGAMDLFETETILSPAGEGPESLGRVNLQLRQQGLATDYLVFHTGMFLSAIRQADRAIVALDPNSFSEVAQFASLEDWYLNGLRAEYWERYGLPPSRAPPANHE